MKMARHSGRACSLAVVMSNLDIGIVKVRRKRVWCDREPSTGVPGGAVASKTVTSS